MAGRYNGRSDNGVGFEQFQSSPGLMAGRYVRSLQDYEFAVLVSILARLNGRALHQRQCCCKDGLMFQSSPGLMAGRYWPGSCWIPRADCFNPRPA